MTYTVRIDGGVRTIQGPKDKNGVWHQDYVCAVCDNYTAPWPSTHVNHKIGGRIASMLVRDHIRAEHPGWKPTEAFYEKIENEPVEQPPAVQPVQTTLKPWKKPPVDPYAPEPSPNRPPISPWEGD